MTAVRPDLPTTVRAHGAWLRNCLAALCVVVLLTGCGAAPIRADHLQDPAMQAIDTAFRNTVRAAHDSTKLDWHSGWTGNMWINFWRGNNRGLCYQWQQLVYTGVLPTVRRVGWKAVGVVINQGASHEHHAVIVFDPRRIDEKNLLKAPRSAPAYVLDAWRRGQADVYRLADWLQLAWVVQVPARLQQLQPTDVRHASDDH